LKKTFIKNPDSKLNKLLKKLKQKSHKDYFLVEKLRNTLCFLEAGFKLRSLISTEENFKNFKPGTFESLSTFQLEILDQKLYKSLNEMNSLPDLLSIFERKENLLKTKDFVDKDFLIIDRIQDPGNLGTILRTALASGWEKIICLKETVDPFSPKVTRASAGFLAYLDIYSQVSFEDLNNFLIDLKTELESKKKQNLEIYNSSPHQGIINQEKNFEFFDSSESLNCLILGNEGKGTSKEWDILSKQKKLKINKIRIPMLNQNKIESLNVAVSSALMMYKLHKLV